ncbi:CbiX/SirB N-terminal domain-containing protein [Phycobacter sp. K97]|uniref:CbiX/SirB N-terminal domain-containing protein n=1 Tax=Phycobacter sedimenti TaxID=3133977 RepID=UPI00311F9210
MTMSATHTAILVAHGQPSAPQPPEAALREVAHAVGTHLPGWEVRSATLACPGALEKVMVDGAVIYPFFMARGWFTSKVLPDRLKGRNYIMATPFGLDPDLPGVAAGMVRGAQRAAGWSEQPLSLLLAAHGSARGPKAAEAAEDFAARLRDLLPGATIEPAYVEQAPGIDEAARALPAQTLCLPFFAQSGDHVRQDIPEALAEAAFQGALLPVLGSAEGVPTLIARAIRHTLGKD